MNCTTFFFPSIVAFFLSYRKLCRMIEAYEKMEKLLLEEHVYLKPGMDFGKLCSRIGADPQDLDRLVQEELGMSGDELMETFRRQFFRVYKR